MGDAGVTTAVLEFELVVENDFDLARVEVAVAWCTVFVSVIVEVERAVFVEV